jgi:hypothetical protein
MKYTILLILLSLVHISLTAQNVYVLKGDSVIFTDKKPNGNVDSTELIIENHSQGVPGFLYNRGRGRTEFRRAFMSLNDTTYLVGLDTLKTPGPSYWLPNGDAVYDINTGNTGIHRLSPKALLDLPGAVNIDDTSAYRMNNTSILRMDGPAGSHTNFYLGSLTGTGNTGKYNTYLGPQAGGYQVAGDANTFVGSYAGLNYTLAGYPSGRNTFVGALAAESHSGTDLIVIGIDAADQEYGSSTIAVGNSASVYNGGKTNSIIIGDVAGTSTNATSTNLSTYIGGMAGAIETKAQSNNTLIGASTSIITGPQIPSTNTSNATVIGYQAIAKTSNTMVFGDASVRSWLFSSGATAATGKAFIVGSNATNGNGAYLSTGGVWTNASDFHKKENFRSLDETALLDKIDQLPVTRWNYKGLSDRHIGPMAQDFYQLFQLGENDKAISTIDPSGIALGAVQGLFHRWQRSQQLSAQQLQQLMSLQHHLQDQRAQLNLLLQQWETQEAELTRQDEEFQKLIDRVNTTSTTQQN